MGRKGDSGPARACSTRTKETPAWFRPAGWGLEDSPFDLGHCLHREVQQISKYIEDNGSQVSYHRRRKV